MTRSKRFTQQKGEVMQLLKTALLGLLLASPLSHADKKFGGGADMKKVVSVDTILETPKTFMQKPVTIKGTIVKVCRKRGCWMTLAADKKYESLTVKVPDGQMVFPMSAMGKTAYATGQLTANELDLEKTRDYLAHQAKEAKQAFDPASVTTAMTVYRLTPHGVTIVD